MFRGYLKLRAGRVTACRHGVISSSVVFALGHGYEGLPAPVDAGVFGVVMALLYRWRGS